MKHLRKFNESNINTSEKLVEDILDACKLDVDGIREDDPDFIPYIADMINKWHEENK